MMRKLDEAARDIFQCTHTRIHTHTGKNRNTHAHTAASPWNKRVIADRRGAGKPAGEESTPFPLADIISRPLRAARRAHLPARTPARTPLLLLRSSEETPRSPGLEIDLCAALFPSRNITRRHYSPRDTTQKQYCSSRG